MSEFIQIKGRTVRNGSLSRLPEDKRTVRLYTFCGVAKEGLTFEARKYIKKIMKFKEIQKIEYNINKNAINNYIYEKKKFSSEDALGALSFKIESPVSEISEKEYFFTDSHKYIFDTISNVIYRAFVANPVWTRNELWEFVKKNPAIPIHLNRQLYEDIFDYTLTNLVYGFKPPINLRFQAGMSVINGIFIKQYAGGKTLDSDNLNRVVIYVGGKFILIPYSNGQINTGANSFLIRKKFNYRSVYQVTPDNKYKYRSHYDKLISEFEKSNQKNRLKYLFLLEFEEESHYMILREHITGIITLPTEIQDLYIRLELLGENWFVDRDKMHKYENGEWNIYNHEKNGRPENDIIVGIIANKAFKIRDPKSEKHLDLRLDSRGSVCKTHKKEKLLEIYNKLNLVVTSKQIYSICDDLFIKLVELECQSIISENGLKYLYLYNE